MSHLQSAHHAGGTVSKHNTFLVVFKVHGDTIHLWPKDINNPQTFSIACHNVETHSTDPSSDIQVIILKEPTSASKHEQCTFQNQPVHGQQVCSSDMAMFITGPVASTRKTSFAFDVFTNNDKDLTTNIDKIGTAYIFLDPSFSSQGAQRTPIVAAHNHVPIGQIQVDYLIVTNPVGYGLAAPRPEWLFAEPIIAGHRGAGSGRRRDLPGDLLENTVESFNYAYRNGAEFCELDVLVSADGVPVVYHDFDVDAITAHQSKSELGRFRIQVNEFTVKQLRDFQFVSLHDEDGHTFTLNVPNQMETNRPFPTLAEVLDQVDKGCGLNIEIKWPQLLENGRMEARRYREINDFVDRIIDVVNEHARDRRIILESFEPDLVIMLRMKQSRFPVMFLSQGMTDKYDRYADIRTRSVTNGVYFAHAFDLVGIDLIAEYYQVAGTELVDFIRTHNLVPRAWGHLEPETLDFLKNIGLQCITCDKVDQFLREAEKEKENVFRKRDIKIEDKSNLATIKNLLSYINQLEPDIAKSDWFKCSSDLCEEKTNSSPSISSNISTTS